MTKVTFATDIINFNKCFSKQKVKYNLTESRDINYIVSNPIKM